VVTTRYGTRPVKIEQLTGPYEPNGQPDPHLGQPLQLGLFAWNIQGGSTGSKAVLADPDRYQNYWKWPLASKLITEAERIGFDYQVPFARWIGQGGDTDWNETCLESLTAAAAASSITSRMLQFSTAHSNYEFHPFHFAKFGVTVDHISDGRWGLNMVTGYSAKEYAAFGHIEPPEHDESYRRADEFFTLVKALWASDVPIIFEGEYYQCYGAYVNPKPTRKPRPLLMQAGQSPVGIDFACRHAEWIFQIQPQIENYRTVAKDIHDKAASYGRRVLVATQLWPIIDKTDAAAQATAEWIAEEIDHQATMNFIQSAKRQHISSTFGWIEAEEESADPYGGIGRDLFMRMGLGIGGPFSVLVVVAQNAFPDRNLGEVTAGSRFFRSMGSTVGAQLMGSLLSLWFAANLRERLPAEVREALGPERLAEASNPEALFVPEATASLREALSDAAPAVTDLLMEALRLGLADALRGLFVVTAGLMVVGFAIAVFLPEIPLRTMRDADLPAGKSDAAPAVPGG